jgi:hypothetical protein
MKYRFLLAGLIGSILFSSCSKKVKVGPVYSGKIIKSACGNIVVQFTDGTKMGQSRWEDNGKVYKHVFAVENPCTWNPAGVTGENIRFRLVRLTPQNCEQCLIFVTVPDTKYPILVEK